MNRFPSEFTKPIASQLKNSKASVTPINDSNNLFGLSCSVFRLFPISTFLAFLPMTLSPNFPFFYLVVLFPSPSFPLRFALRSGAGRSKEGSFFSASPILNRMASSPDPFFSFASVISLFGHSSRTDALFPPPFTIPYFDHLKAAPVTEALFVPPFPHPSPDLPYFFYRPLRKSQFSAS